MRKLLLLLRGVDGRPKRGMYVYMKKNVFNGDPLSHCYRKPEPAGNHDTGVRLSVMVGRGVWGFGRT